MMEMDLEIPAVGFDYAREAVLSLLPSESKSICDKEYLIIIIIIIIMKLHLF